MASGKYVSFDDSILSRMLRILEEQALGQREEVWKNHNDMVNAGLVFLLKELGEEVPDELVKWFKDKVRDAKADKKKREAQAQ